MACRHPDVQKFDGVRCCLSCGEAVFEDQDAPSSLADTSSTTVYQYMPLNHKLGQMIRLVALNPGQGDEELACDIVHVNLTDNPAYEAISYTWATADGDASRSQIIMCRGKRIAITKNCEAALRCLRRRGSSRRLWVDAISIDQDNTSERNLQVKLMATIYSNASQVVAYINPEPVMTKSATNSIIKHLEQNIGDWQEIRFGDHWGDLESFLGLRYFDRAWVIQEIALAKLVTLVAGDTSVHWTASIMMRLYTLCKTLSVDVPSALRWLPASQPGEEDLLDVLYKCRNSSATDPRDKVFACLSLVDREIAESFAIDYSKDPLEIFIYTAVYMICDQRRIDTILHATKQNVDTDVAPSWVPQWDLKRSYNPISPQFTPDQTSSFTGCWFFPSSRSQNPPFSDDAFIYTSEQLREQYEQFEFYICERDRPILSSRTQPQSRSWDTITSLPCLRIRAHFLDTIVKILPTATSNRSSILPNKEIPAFGLYRSCNICSDDPDARNQANHHTGASDLVQRQSYKEELGWTDMRKTPFVTTQSMGTCQKSKSEDGIQLELKCDDTIWALPGLNVPLILRPVDGHYVLVRECHLFRAMLGHLCAYCGRETQPWPVVTQIIDIW